MEGLLTFAAATQLVGIEHLVADSPVLRGGQVQHLAFLGEVVSDVAPGAERDAEFFRINGLLLRNTSAVNALDGCGISLPCHAPGELPVGLMAWHAAMHDDSILQLALLLEPLLQQH